MCSRNKCELELINQIPVDKVKLCVNRVAQNTSGLELDIFFFECLFKDIIQYTKITKHIRRRDSKIKT